MAGRPPARPPLGLQLARTARAVTNAFERALSEAGGSLSIWQVLLLVQTRQWATQSDLAEAMGVTQGTLTHHLNAAEAQGLVRRWREPGNRRVQRVELTPAGIEMFTRLRQVAAAHDRRLRAHMTTEQSALLVGLLDALQRSVDPALPSNE
jgi:MarR family transcriptional regulator, transcriptional regulator for hemolysin